MSKRKSLAELMSEGSIPTPDLDNLERQGGAILTEAQTSQITDSGSDLLTEPGIPKYLHLARKEARLRDDQFEALTILRRRLNRRRQGRGERITDNTLIRVAVDLLLAKRDALRGNSEEELLESLKQGR